MLTANLMSIRDLKNTVLDGDPQSEEGDLSESSVQPPSRNERINSFFFFFLGAPSLWLWGNQAGKDQSVLSLT